MTKQNEIHGWQAWFFEFRRFLHPQSIVLLLLGFSAGLPFLLISGTLSAWLQESGLDYKSIGFFAWVGLAFSIKFFWAPFVDQLRFPFLCKWLGQRRGWLLAAQAGICFGLFWMSSLAPAAQPGLLALIAVFVAFCAATQDVCVDAYRIQACDEDMQGVVTTSYIAGYRLALLMSGAGALFIAEGYGWAWSYKVMGILVGVGMITVLWMKEPALIVQSVISSKANATWIDKILRWCWRNILDPFAEMVQRFGGFFLLLILVVLFYRVSDIAMGNMANPFYLALAYTKTDIAWVTKIFGLVMVLAGSAIGGLMVARQGLFRSMLLCLFSVILTNLLFSALAVVGASCLNIVGECESPSLVWLGFVISADNIAAGASNVVFIAFLSSQVNLQYSATQYALLSSLMTFLGKFISGFSGIMVESFGFSWFFIYVSCLGLPSLLLLSALRYWRPSCFETRSNVGPRNLNDE